jgi:hypothetical protein
MNKMTRILHVLLVALVALTGVSPVVPAASAAPDLPLPLAETRQQAMPLAPLAADQAASESAAPTQGPEAIDPSASNQGFPSAASDADGNVYVVWQDYRDGDPHVRFSERPADGSWQESIQIDSTASGDQEIPLIAVDGSGNLYAVWKDNRGSSSQIYFAYRPAGDDWGVSEPISATTEAQDRPTLAVNRRGEAVVAWRQGAWPIFHVFSAIRPAGGGWSAVERRTESGSEIATTDAALDDWGRVYLAWEVWGDQTFFAERSPDGSWSANEPIRDTSSGSSWGVQIAVDGVGNVHAVWEDDRSGGSQIYAAYRPVGGPWSVNVRIDEGAGNTWSPGLGIDGAGNVIAAWSEGEQIFGAARYLGSGWGPSELLAEPPTRSGKSNREPTQHGPQAIESYPPGIGIGIGIALVFSDNIYWQNLSPLGSNGNCGGILAP